MLFKRKKKYEKGEEDTQRQRIFEAKNEDDDNEAQTDNCHEEIEVTGGNKTGE